GAGAGDATPGSRPDRRRPWPAQRGAQGAAGPRPRLPSRRRARQAAGGGLRRREPPPALARPDVARAPRAPEGPRRGPPLRDHLPQEAPVETDVAVRAG